jgi:hypothetical protein
MLVQVIGYATKQKMEKRNKNSLFYKEEFVDCFDNAANNF